jgi:hypothetical protein
MEVCVEVGTFGTELICGECGWSRQLFDLWRVWERRPMLGGVSDRLLLTNNRSLVHSSHPDPSWVLLNQLLAPFVVARLDGQYGWEERVVCVSAELALWVADAFDPAYAYFAGRVADGDRGDVYELALGLWQQPSDPWAPAVETLEDPAEALELARRLGGAGNGTTRVGAES